MISNPHDKFFKAVFSSTKLTKSLLDELLGEDIHKLIDLEGLKLTDNSYVNEDLQESFADLVFTAPTKDGPGELKIALLIEHKSYKPQWVRLQILRYLLEYHKQLEREKQSFQPLYPSYSIMEQRIGGQKHSVNIIPG